MKKFGVVAVLALLVGNAFANQPSYESIVPESTEGIAAAQYVEEIAKALEADYHNQVWNLDGTTTGSGAVVTGVQQLDGVVTATLGHVQIPVGDANGTGGTAAIWIE